MHLSVGKAAALLGISISTLRRWEADGYLQPSYRIKGSHRRYAMSLLVSKFNSECPDSASPPKAVAYARVSSHDQRKDLGTRKSKLEDYCRQHFAAFEVLTDLGSGLNYRKPGLKKLLCMIFQRQMSHLILIHKDRFLRSGADQVLGPCRHFGVEALVPQSQPDQSFEMELATDVIELMAVFSSRLSHQNRKLAAA